MKLSPGWLLAALLAVLAVLAVVSVSEAVGEYRLAGGPAVINRAAYRMGEWQLSGLVVVLASQPQALAHSVFVPLVMR